MTSLFSHLISMVTSGYDLEKLAKSFGSIPAV
jgi:hypothetical protein